MNGLQTVSSGLASELKKFVDNGGSIFIFPGENLDFQSYNDFLLPLGVNSFEKLDTARTIVDQLNFSHPIFSGVFEKTSGNIDLPSAYHHYKISSGIRTTQEE